MVSSTGPKSDVRIWRRVVKVASTAIGEATEAEAEAEDVAAALVVSEAAEEAAAVEVRRLESRLLKTPFDLLQTWAAFPQHGRIWAFIWGTYRTVFILQKLGYEKAHSRSFSTLGGWGLPIERATLLNIITMNSGFFENQMR